jgi:amino acid adenylation domain-containing protein
VPFYGELMAHARLEASAEEQEQFFGKLLGDIDQPTAPFGLTEMQRDGRRVEEARMLLPSALNTRLRAHAQRLGVSLASICHLAWGQVVARTSGRVQVVFGTVLFGRMHGGVSGNALPIRLNLDDTGVEASVRQTYLVLTELSRHEHASLALAQRCSGVPAPAPLFGALLAYRDDCVQTNTDAAADRALADVDWLGGHEGTSYPVVLSVDDFGNAMGLTARVVAPVSPSRVCAMMERTLEQLSEALEQRPSASARTLDVLPAAERTLLLKTWNATEASYPSEACIHELFEEQVERTPHAIAIVQGDVALTYAELNAQANQLAHRLIALGVGPDRLVGLCVERRPYLVIGLLAILKAGGAYVPLDLSYPRERLQELVSDADPVLVLVDAAGRQALALDAADDGVARVSVDDPAGWATARDSNPQVAGLSSRHLAYVIYTSGSTGAPKGAQNEHRAIVNRLVWMQRAYELDGTDIVLQKTPYSFDVSVWELFWTLMYGATMLLAAPDGQRDATYLVELIQQHGVTTVHFVPSMLSSFVEASGVERCTSLRRVICSGEELPVATMAACRRVLPSARLDNLYGPTEAAIDVTSWRCPDEFAGLRVPIGRPIANTQIYLLDAYREPVPVGVVGEIYIGGAGVARGYLNRPELTSDRFVADPFSRAVGARMYRTGDLAKYLPDGNVEFLGRNDHQVKIRGHRVELGEIEARATAHALVRNAVVVALEDGVGNKRLVAYVTTDAEYEQELASTLREHLARQLPGYMVPSTYVRLDALPLTANGKLDRNALAIRDVLPTSSRPPGEAPPLPLERELMQLWTEMLGIPVMSTASNFFELGGHSLVLVQIGNRLRTVFGVDLQLRILFDTPTIAQLAREITGRLAALTSDDELDELLTQIEALAPEEAQRLLDLPD